LSCFLRLKETAPNKLLLLLIERHRTGTHLWQIVATAALANARTIGGDNYVGFHTLMRLTPSYHMSHELPEEQQASSSPSPLVTHFALLILTFITIMLYFSMYKAREETR